MAQFRKKPVVVDAFLWTGGPDQTEDPQWIVDAIKSRAVTFARPMGAFVREGEVSHMLIETLEGVVIARPGDWIIKGEQGEIYHCKPDIFAATYSPA